MKEYPSIDGPNSNLGKPCIAFKKYDGSNMRAEWSKKRGWYKFGTRTQLIDENDKNFGHGIKLFMDKLAGPVIEHIKFAKEHRNVESLTAFFELHSPSCLGMWRNEQDFKSNADVTLIDVWVNKRGFILPNVFYNVFNFKNVAEAVYIGNFNKQFIQDVYEGKIVDGEGIVAKGINVGSGKPQHHIWMSKVKTKKWLDDIKNIATIHNAKSYLAEEERYRI